MSYDIFVQDMPNQIRSLADIPHDFIPRSLGPASKIREAIRLIFPLADFADPTWVRVNCDGLHIEIDIPDGNEIDCFAFHIYGGEHSMAFVNSVLHQLQLKGIDPGSDTGLFEAATSAEDFKRWQDYRSRALNQN